MRCHEFLVWSQPFLDPVHLGLLRCFDFSLVHNHTFAEFAVGAVAIDGNILILAFYERLTPLLVFFISSDFISYKPLT